MPSLLSDLVGRCLTRVRQERIGCVVLVAPVWPHQPWYPHLLQRLSAAPLLLPVPQLRDPYGNHHPLHRSLQLGVWTISGLPFRNEAFQRRLRTCGSPRGDRPQLDDATYDSAWRQFDRWCGEREIDCFSATPTVVSNFFERRICSRESLPYAECLPVCHTGRLCLHQMASQSDSTRMFAMLCVVCTILAPLSGHSQP